MHVDRIPNRTSPPAYLLRETYREGGKVKKRTLANITHWPLAKIEALRRLLRDEPLTGDRGDGLRLLRSLPHGHVAAAFGILRKAGLEYVLAQGGRQPAREVALCIAMLVARLIDPASKLATARLLDGETASCSLGAVLGLGAVDEQELYGALDWLVGQQDRIEKALARRHLKNGMLVLYDVTSTYFEGRSCPLARFGYNRDGKSGKLQIVFGLLCTTEGCPVAVEVFEGNVGDPSTLASQIAKLKERFALERVVLVGDRGLITQARLEEILKPAGLDWITALRAPAIRSLVEAAAIQLSLFDQRDLAEIASPDYPGERLVVCRNPLLAEERARKRRDLLDATEKKLIPIQTRVRRAKKPLRGKDKIALAVGRVIDHYKMAKHFTVVIADDDLTFTRNTAQIDAEAALDGVYVLRTSLKPETLEPPQPSKPTNSSLTSSAPSEASRRSISRSGLFITAGLTACARTCSCACSRIMSNGTCVRRLSLSCLMITTKLPPMPPAAPSSPKPSVPRPPTARPSQSAPMTDWPSTASARCSAISPPSPKTPWRWSASPAPPSCSIPNSQPSRPVPSSFLKSPSKCSQ